MDHRLLLTGFSLLVASVLLSVYGYLASDGGLLGIGFSAMVLSAVLVVLAYEPNPQTREALASYITTLSKALAGVLEDLDLLPPRVRVVCVRDKKLLVVSKSVIEPAGPGIGVVGGAPYLALSLEDLGLEVQSLDTVTGEQVELCVERLVGELLEASDVSVRFSGDTVRISLYGVPDMLNELSIYPVNPLVVATLGATSRCLRRNLTLIDYSKSGRDHHIAIEVEGYVE